jgi:hypothetical protein
MNYVVPKELEQMSASEANEVLIALQRRVKLHEERIAKLESRWDGEKV